mmetsp:Transcript_106728/g.148759  ORF Transcript_106728/g.148759 Transcript_106728/m.148759 type:complete len:149 (+) Transcript_106728:20-466(+)
MTKSDSSFFSTPAAEPCVVEGYVVGSSPGETVSVIPVDDDNNQGDTDTNGNNFHTANNANILLNGSRNPINLHMCPNCFQSNIRTKTRTYPSAVTWVGVVVGVAVFFPLCWIPLVVDPLKQTDHHCQNCGQKIGTVKPLDGCFVKERM